MRMRILDEKKLNDIFITNIKIDFSISVEKRDKKFFGTELNIAPRSLAKIYMDIQEKFDVKIPESALLDKQFDTYENVLNLLQELTKSDD